MKKFFKPLLGLVAALALAVTIGISASTLQATPAQAATGDRSASISCASGQYAVLNVQVYNADVTVIGSNTYGAGARQLPPASYVWQDRDPDSWFWTGYHGFKRQSTKFQMYSSGTYGYTISCAWAY